MTTSSTARKRRRRNQRQSGISSSGDEGELDAATLSNWRRVASTHRLEDLLRAPPKQRHAAGQLAVTGVLLMALAVIVAAWAVYALVVSQPRHEAAEASSDHLFYVQAVAAGLPVTIAFIAVNWFSNKLFKHNT